MFRRYVAVAVPLVVLSGCSPSSPSAAAPRKGTGSGGSPQVGGTARSPAAVTPKPNQPAPGAPKSESLWSQALKVARAGNLQAAGELLDRLLAAEPDHRQALPLRAEILQRQAGAPGVPNRGPLLLRSAALMRRLRSAYKDLDPAETVLLWKVLYNEACQFALEGRTDRALDSLTEAPALGPFAVEKLESDPDLDALRPLPRFQALQAAAERVAQLQALELAREALARRQPFAFPFRFPDLDGRIVTPADFRGKVTVVNIWATGCFPSRKALLPLIDLYRRNHGRGLEVVGICVEGVPEEQARRTVRTFLKEHGIPYPCLIGSDAALRPLLPGLSVLPTTLFLDRAGRVRLQADGYQPLRDLEAVARLLLAEGSAGPPYRPTEPGANAAEDASAGLGGSPSP